MVHRMLGNRFGTGGSSGHEYLRVTAARSRIFSDFFNLAGYYIPKVMLPALPPDLQEQLGFCLQQALSSSGSPRARAGSFGSFSSGTFRSLFQIYLSIKFYLKILDACV
jgi:hypothetical protein